MPLSRQEISDINSTLFKVDARQKSGHRANTQNKFAAATSSFIPTNEEKEEINKSLILWSGMDDTAFEAVLFYHPLLARILRWLILDLSGMSSSSSSSENHASQKQVLAALRLCIGRSILWQPTHDPAQIQSSQDPSLYSERLDTLFPPDIITAVALIVGKFSPLYASIVITSWSLQNPTSVSALTSFGGLWCSRIVELNAHIASLARKGRFERTVEEISRVIGQCRSSVLGTWSLIHSCPSLADFFCALPKFVSTCRIIAEEICPTLQHFVFTCDRLASVRPKLVRIVQKIANASVDIATISMMFASHWSSSNNSTFKEYIKQYDRAISEQIRNKGGFVARVMLKGNYTGGVRETILSFMPSSSFAIPDESDRVRCLRDAFPALEDNMSSQSAKHSGKLQHSVYFAEQVLRRMAQQKIKLFPDDAPGLISNEKKKELSSNNNKDKKGSSSTTAAAPAASASPPATTTSESTQQQYAELVPMVMEILPQLPRIAVLKGLDYYKGNIEKFIEDAMTENLPPHVSSDDAPAASATGDSNNTNASMMSFGEKIEQYYESGDNQQQSSNNNNLTFKSVAELLNAIDEQFFTSNPNSNTNISGNNNNNQQQQVSTSSSPSNTKDSNETVMQLLMGEELFDLINNGTSKNNNNMNKNNNRVIMDNNNNDDDDDDEVVNNFANIMNDDDIAAPGMMYNNRMKTGSSDDWNLAPIGQDLVDKTRELMDRMYTDEWDDAGLGNEMPDVRPLNFKKKGNTIASDDDVSDDDDDSEGADNNKGEDGSSAADGSSSSRPPTIQRYEYNDENGADGFFLSGRNIQSATHGDTTDKAKRPRHGTGGGAAPSYAKKPKSDWRKNETKRHTQAKNNAGGGTKKQNTKQIMKSMAAGGGH